MSAEFFAYSDFADLSEPFIMVFAIIWMIFGLIGIALGVTMYILQSMGLYNIAKRRGIHHPGLAWVPVANMWIIGSISDQYQYVVKGKVRNRRKVLLGLMIAVYVLMIVYLVLFVAGMFNVDMMMADTFDVTFFASMGSAFAVAMAMWMVSVIAGVFLYIAFFDLYRSCNPDNAVLFLILGIFFDFLQPIFIFVCRKKDEGMPPRKIQVPVAPWTPAPPPPAPTWQQSVAPAEPVEEVPAEEPIAEETTEE